MKTRTPIYLKSCPFCGGDAYLMHSPLNKTYEIVCDDCESSTRGSYKKEDVIESWNKRKEVKK